MDWQANKSLLTDGEIKVLEELDRHGFITSFHPDRRERFFVGAGSHGGAAPSLRKAMKKCLGCCHIYKFWKIDHGEGMMAFDWFNKLYREYLGGVK